jgi:hypothetical protein
MKKFIPSNKQVILEVSTERSIAEVQLERLREIAMERLLTPDETKQYDILVKNLMLIRGQPTNINANASSVVDELSDAELVRLATLPLKEVESDER